MIKKPILYLNDEKKFIKEYDFFKFTEFNPDGIENLLNLSFNNYFLKEDLLKKIMEQRKKMFSLYYKKFNNLLEMNKTANEVCLKKLQYITLYKLNWNIPERIIDNLQKILVFEFDSVFEGYFLLNDIFKISPLQYNFFIKNIFPDILTVFLSNIIKRTTLGNSIAKDGYINFRQLPILVRILKINILDNKSEFNIFQKGLLWSSVVKDNWFKWNLTFEDNGIVKLINNEVYFDKYFGIIDKYFSDINNSLEIRKLKKNISEKAKLLLFTQNIQNQNIKLQEEKRELEKKLMSKEKNKKYETLAHFRNSHTHNWKNIKLLFSVNLKIIAYEIIDHKMKINMTERLRKILIKICLAPESPDIEYNKQERYEINLFLKETFNIGRNAIIWNRNQKIYKINFAYKFLKYKKDYKMKTESGIEDGFTFVADKDGNHKAFSTQQVDEYSREIAGYEDYYPNE
jgi:hypothetical protein